MGVFDEKNAERIGRYQAAYARERPPEAPFGRRMSNEDALKMSKAAARNLMDAARMRGERMAPILAAEAQAEYEAAIEAHEKMLEYAHKQAEWSRRPLTQQETSDAWNERQRRLSSGAMAAQILIRSTMAINKLKKQNETK